MSECLGCNRLEVATVTMPSGAVVCDQCPEIGRSEQDGNRATAAIQARGAVLAEFPAQTVQALKSRR